MGLMGLFNLCVNEIEVDCIGVELVVCGGYDFKVVVMLWQKMVSLGGDELMKFMFIYFFSSECIVDLMVYVQCVELLYQQICKC